MKKALAVIVICFMAGLALGQDKPVSINPVPNVITKDVIEKRLADLQQQLEQAKANLHAYEGAIADCKFWLEQLDKLSQSKPEILPAPMPEKK
jgi:hypothetical protein